MFLFTLPSWIATTSGRPPTTRARSKQEAELANEKMSIITQHANHVREGDKEADGNQPSKQKSHKCHVWKVQKMLFFLVWMGILFRVQGVGLDNDISLMSSTVLELD